MVLPQSKAAPCCAGGSAVPALITGDELRVFSVGVSYGNVMGDAPPAGGGWPTFRDDLSPSESKQTLAISYAQLLDHDRLQAGITVPVVVNHLVTATQSNSSTQLGDFSVTLGYETMPEWDYSEWKPRVFNFIQLVLPTGQSIYQSSDSYSTDVGGLGFWQLHLGGIALKKWNAWDASIVANIGYYFGQSFTSSSTGEVTNVGSTWSLVGSVSGGYSFAELWRVGMSIEPQYLFPQSVSSDGALPSTSPKMLWNTTFACSVLIGQDSSLALTYVDQTLLGPAINTTLSRTLGLSYQLRWER